MKLLLSGKERNAECIYFNLQISSILFSLAVRMLNVYYITFEYFDMYYISDCLEHFVCDTISRKCFK